MELGILIRTSKNKVKLGSFEEAKSLSKQALGVMGRDEIKRPMVFFLNPKEDGHTFHTFFCTKLSMVFLDSGKKVIAIHPVVSPFSLVTSPSNASFLIEDSPNNFEKIDLKVGDIIDFS